MLSEIGEDTIYVDEARKLAVNKEVMDDKRLDETEIDKTALKEYRAIEVGNIFPLESKYTDALGVFYNDEDGKQQKIIAGCYGIGVSRLMGALAEHFSDERGLVWPENVAPAKVYLISVGNGDSVVKATDELYKTLQKHGVEVLYDDRDVRPGEKFADADLLGIPYRVVVSEKTLEQGKIELKQRTEKESKLVTKDELTKVLGVN